jgi:hypothetical protein
VLLIGAPGVAARLSVYAGGDTDGPIGELLTGT